MPEGTVTVSEFLARAASELRAAGIPESRKEAVRLWADLNGEATGRALLEPARSIDITAGSRFLAAVERRASGEPLAYVTGRTGFRHLQLRIDRCALIPRPETEGLVELVLGRVSSGRIADVGTGSGCIALSLATEGHYDAVLATERSSAALEMAKLNRQLIGAWIEVIQGDLTEPLATGSLDGLVANPPYLTEGEYVDLDPGVSRWEPREALVSGSTGLELTLRLLDDGRRVLRPGGWLGLEVDVNRAPSVARQADQVGWEAVELRADLFGRERYLLARRSTRP